MAKKKKTTSPTYKRLTTIIILIGALAYYLGLIPAEWFTEVGTLTARSHYEHTPQTESIEIPLSPKGIPEQILRRTNYTASFNAKTNLPNWVAWAITPDELIERESRNNNFQPDPAQPTHMAVTTEDYTGSGYDRGHMCPAADNKFHWRAMDECFYMTNICPQNHNLNAGVWSTLEQQCRRWAETGTTVYIACGPILDPNHKAQHIGNKHQVRIPEAFFKVVLYGLETSHPKAFGFVFENKAGKKPLSHYARTVDEIEVLTGYDFFAPLDDAFEQQIEATKYNL